MNFGRFKFIESKDKSVRVIEYILVENIVIVASRSTVVNGYVELSHKSKNSETPAIRATDHHVNDNKPHSISIRGNGAEWSLELDRLTTEYGRERDVDIQQLLTSTNLIYIGKPDTN